MPTSPKAVPGPAEQQAADRPWSATSGEERRRRPGFPAMPVDCVDSDQLLCNLRRMLEHCRRHQRQLTVLCIGLDDLRQIADEHGRDIAGRLRQRITKRLRGNLRATDLLARLDDDCFVVASALPEGRALPHLLGERLLEQLGRPFEFTERCMVLKASLGIALHTDADTSAERLLEDAIQAMYQARAKGGQALHADHDAPPERPEPGYRMAARLRRAIEDGQLEVHYQLQFELSGSHRPSGLEALLRWRDGEAGLIPPERFLPLAADHGLMPALSRWLAQRACRDNRALIDAGLLDVPVAINVCADTFLHDAFLASIRQALAESGLPGERLEVEIVESAALYDLEKAARHIRELKRLRVKVSMDDFGSGYSSPALLKRLPVDRIKIDRSFIAPLPESPVDQAIVRGILNIAASTGIQVVAEGIERFAQVEYLRRQGCRFGQGFWYASPLPHAELLARLAQPAFTTTCGAEADR